MMKKKILNFFLLFSLLFITSDSFAQSGKGPIFIRDAEIEHALRRYSTPIFKAAGIPPEDVDIRIVQDNSLNAFVSGGMNIFIHTGLITESEDPLILIGVIAHETGHISGGHLVRRREDYENALLGSAISYVLGAASIAAGSSEAGAAIISGGQHVATMNILKHSRVHEQSADQAALNFLEKSKTSAEGLLELLKILGGNETLFYSDVNPYILTHPLSQDRVNHLEEYLNSSPFTGKKVPKELRDIQVRIVAKIKAFLDDPEKTLNDNPTSDQSIKARYSRAVAYHKKSLLRESLVEIDSLLKESPEDPYYNELKGQILFEHGKVKESIPFYQKAVDTIPESSLMRLELATAQIASEDKKLLPDAIKTLEIAIIRNPESPITWRQLGIAYGKNGNLGMSYLALAEEAALLGKKEDSLSFTKKAEKYIREDDPAMLRIKDVRQFLENKYPEKSFF